MARPTPDAPLNHASESEHRRLIALRANQSMLLGSAPGNGLLDGTPQALSGPGAIDPAEPITLLTTTGADALTLADGVDPQLKIIIMAVDGGPGTLTPDNLSNGTSITFDDVGDSALLVFANGSWNFIGGTATLA